MAQSINFETSNHWAHKNISRGERVKIRNTNNAGIIRQNSLICGSVATLPHLKEAGKLVWAYDQDVSSRLHLSVSLGWHGDGGWEKRGLGFIP